MATTLTIPEGFVLEEQSDIPEGFALESQSDIPEGFTLEDPVSPEERDRRGKAARSRLALVREQETTRPDKQDASKIPARVAIAASEELLPTLKKMGAEAGIQVASLPERWLKTIGDYIGDPDGSAAEYEAKRTTPAMAAEEESRLRAGQAVRQYLRGASKNAQEAKQLAAQHAEQIGGGPYADAAAALTITAGVSAPAIPAAILGGLPAALAVSGLTSASSVAADGKRLLMEQGMSEIEAERRIAGPALASGLITTAVTGAFGKTGIEALTQEQVFTGVKQALQQIIRQAGMEAAEETVDEMGQIAVQALTFDPDLINRPEELQLRIAAAAGAGGMLGGAATTGRAGLSGLPAGARRVSDSLTMGAENARLDSASSRAAQDKANRFTPPQAEVRDVSTLPHDQAGEAWQSTPTTGFNESPTVSFVDGVAVNAATGEPLPAGELEAATTQDKAVSAFQLPADLLPVYQAMSEQVAETVSGKRRYRGPSVVVGQVEVPGTDAGLNIVIDPTQAANPSLANLIAVAQLLAENPDLSAPEQGAAMNLADRLRVFVNRNVRIAAESQRNIRQQTGQPMLGRSENELLAAIRGKPGFLLSAEERILLQKAAQAPMAPTTFLPEQPQPQPWQPSETNPSATMMASELQRRSQAPFRPEVVAANLQAASQSRRPPAPTKTLSPETPVSTSAETAAKTETAPNPAPAAEQPTGEVVDGEAEPSQDGMIFKAPLVKLTGPNGKQYWFRYEGVDPALSEFYKKTVHQLTPVGKPPGLSFQSTTYADPLQKKGWKLPNAWPATPKREKTAQEVFAEEKAKLKKIAPVQATVEPPVPVPAPAPQTSPELDAAMSELEEIEIDPETTKGKAVKLAKKLNKQGLVADTTVKEIERLAKDRDMSAEDLTSEIRSDLVNRPATQPAAAPAAPPVITKRPDAEVMPLMEPLIEKENLPGIIKLAKESGWTYDQKKMELKSHSGDVGLQFDPKDLKKLAKAKLAEVNALLDGFNQKQETTNVKENREVAAKEPTVEPKPEAEAKPAPAKPATVKKSNRTAAVDDDAALEAEADRQARQRAKTENTEPDATTQEADEQKIEQEPDVKFQPVEAGFNEEVLLSAFKKSARRSGGLGVDESEAAAKAIAARLASGRVRLAKESAVQAEAENLAGPDKAGVAPKKSQVSIKGSPFDIDVESELTDIVSFYRQLTRDLADMRSTMDRQGASRQSVDIDVGREYENTVKLVNEIRKLDPNIDKKASKTYDTGVAAIIEAKAGFDPNRRLDVLEVDNYLSRSARKGKEGSRKTSRSHIIVAETGPDGKTVYRVYTALPKAPNQIRENRPSQTYVVLNPKRQIATTAMGKFDTADLSKFLQQKVRRFVGAFKTKHVYSFYTKPGTKSNQLTKSEVDQILELRRKTQEQSAAAQQALFDRARLTAADLRSTRLSAEMAKTPQGYESENISALDEPNLAEELESAMSDISPTQPTFELASEYETRSELGRLMREPEYAGLAGMFWDAISSTTRPYTSEEFREMSPEKQQEAATGWLVSAMSKDSPLDRIMRALGAQESARERGVLARFVRGITRALATNPTGAAQFISALRAEAVERVDKNAELAAKLARNAALLAPSVSNRPAATIAQHIANTEGFALTMWDAFRFSAIAQGVEDAADVIRNSEPASRFFANTIHQSTAGRSSEIAPILEDAIQLAIDNNVTSYESFKNTIRGAVATRSGAVPKQPSESTKQLRERRANPELIAELEQKLRARRLAAIQGSPTEEGKPNQPPSVVDQIYAKADAIVKSGLAKRNIGVDPVFVAAFITKLSIDIARSSPVREFSEWIRSVPDRIMAQIEMVASRSDMSAEEIARNAHAAAISVLDRPQTGDAARFHYVNSAEEAARAIFQAVSERKHDIAGMILTQQELIPASVIKQASEAGADYEEGDTVPSWLSETTKGERRALAAMLKPASDAKDIITIVKRFESGTEGVDPATLPDDKRGILSEAIIHKYAKLRNLRSRLLQRRDRDVVKLSEISTQLTKDTFKRADVLEAIASGISRNFREFISASAEAEKEAGVRTGVERTAARSLAGKIEELKDATAISKLIDAISKEIPDDVARKSSRQIAKWVSDWDGKKAIVGSEIYNALLSEVDGRSALSSYGELGQVLRWLKRSQGKDAELQAELKTLKDWLNNHKADASDAGKFKRWLDDYRAAAVSAQLASDGIAALNNKAKTLVDKINAAERAVRIYTDLLNDPRFSTQVAAAAEWNDYALNDIVKIAEGHSPRIDFVNPITGLPNSVSFAAEADAGNRLEMQQAISSIEKYLEDPVEFDGVEIPDKQRAYRKTLKTLQTYYLNSEASSAGGGYPDALSRVSVGGVSAAPLSLPNKLAAFTLNERQFFKRIAGLWGQAMAHVADRKDDMERRQSQIDSNPEHGLAAQLVSLKKAAASHGMNFNSNQDVFGVLQDEILEPIIASRQTDGEEPLQVGDKTFGGHIVTQEDLDAAHLMIKWEKEIRKDVQFNPGDSNNKELNAVEIMDGRWSRRAVGVDTTMPSTPSGHMVSFTTGPWQQNTGKPARMALLDDPANPDIFRKAVIGYVADRNPEFRRKSDFNSAYKRVSTLWTKSKLDIPENWTELVNQLLDHGGLSKVGYTNVSDTLFDEISKVIETFVNTETSEDQDWVTGLVDSVLNGITDNKALAAQYAKMTKGLNVPNLPGAISRFVSALNQYTKPRRGLSAPSTFYSYAPVSTGQKSSIKFAAQQVLNLRLYRAMNMASAAIAAKLKDHHKNIERLEGSFRKEGEYMANNLKEVQAGKERASIFQLQRWQDQLDYNMAMLVSGSMGEMLDIGSPARQLWSTLSGAGVGSLLSSAMAMARNFSAMVGVAPSAASISMGGKHPWLTTWSRLTRSSALLPSWFVERLARNNPALESFIKGHKNPITKLLNMALEEGMNLQDGYRRAVEAGIIVTPDWKQRARARRASPARGGTLYREHIPTWVRGFNSILGAPTIAHAIEFWNAKNPNALADRVANAYNYNFYRNKLNTDVRNRIIDAMQVRTQSGSNISPTMDRITATEMGFENERQLGQVRQFLQPSGNLESIAAEVWKRWSAAPEEDKDEVTLFENEKDEQAVIADIAKTIGASAFESTRFSPSKGPGVGGLIKREMFRFLGWPTNWLSHIGSILSTVSSRERRFAAKALMGIIATFLSWMLFAALPQQAGGDWLKENVFREAPSSTTIGNLTTDDPMQIARYVASSSANLFPFVGDAIALGIGSPSARSGRISDYLATRAPAVNLMNDIQEAANTIFQTGDVLLPTASLIKRWSPSPVGLVFNLGSDMVGGETASKASARALRAAAPSDMEIAVRGGGGGVMRRSRLSGITRRMIASAYAGNSGAARRYYNQARRQLSKAGRGNPDQIIAQSIAGKAPARSVFGRELTQQEERKIVSRMTSGQRRNYESGRRAFSMLERITGRKIQYGGNTDEPKRSRL